MSYKRGDVVLVLFHPATTGIKRETKSRPMVVLSSDIYHRERPQDIIVALVTSKVDKYQGKTDYKLHDWQAAGLFEPSVVRSTIATIELNQIEGKIGSLTAPDIHGAEAAIKRALFL